MFRLDPVQDFPGQGSPSPTDDHGTAALSALDEHVLPLTLTVPVQGNPPLVGFCALVEGQDTGDGHR